MVVPLSGRHGGQDDEPAADRLTYEWQNTTYTLLLVDEKQQQRGFVAGAESTRHMNVMFFAETHHGAIHRCAKDAFPQQEAKEVL